jgi:hypothetical protein
MSIVDEMKKSVGDPDVESIHEKSVEAITTYLHEVVDEYTDLMERLDIPPGNSLSLAYALAGLLMLGAVASTRGCEIKDLLEDKEFVKFAFSGAQQGAAMNIQIVMALVKSGAFKFAKPN